MASKAKTKRSGPKISKAKKAKTPEKKASTGKPGRAGGSHVRFGLHGIRTIMNKIHDAGFETEFNNSIGTDNQFVNVNRQTLSKIKDFVESKPELAGLATDMQQCNCPPDDPYCIYL